MTVAGDNMSNLKFRCGTCERIWRKDELDAIELWFPEKMWLFALGNGIIPRRCDTIYRAYCPSCGETIGVLGEYRKKIFIEQAVSTPLFLVW